MFERCDGALDDDGLVFAAALVWLDSLVEFDRERQSAQVLREAPGYAMKRVVGEVAASDHLEHDFAFGVLDGLKLPNDLLPGVAEQHVKDDARHCVAGSVEHGVGAPAVDALEPA